VQGRRLEVDPPRSVSADLERWKQAGRDQRSETDNDDEGEDDVLPDGTARCLYCLRGGKKVVCTANYNLIRAELESKSTCLVARSSA